MATQVEWLPAAGPAIAFTTGRSARFRLVGLGGIEPVPAAVHSAKAPGQFGETLVDTLLPPRVVTLQAVVQTASLAALWAARAELDTALAALPYTAKAPAGSGLTNGLRVGRLRITRDGAATREIPAVVRSASLPQPRNSIGLLPIDIEFYAPDPRWQATTDSSVTIPAVDTNVVATNAGDVPVPLVARIYGPLTTPRLLNLHTGQSIELIGSVADGDYLEIDTARGRRRVDLITAVLNGWGTPDVGPAYAVQLGDAANLSVVDGVGKVTHAAAATNRHTVDVNVQDVRVTGRTRFDKTPTGALVQWMVHARWVDGTNFYRLVGNHEPDGTVDLIVQRVVGNVFTTLVTLSNVLTGVGASWVRYRFEADGINPTNLRVRVWLDGTTEPTTWSWESTDSSAALQVAGDVAYLTTEGAGVTNYPIVNEWDDSQVVDIATSLVVLSDTFDRVRTNAMDRLNLAVADFPQLWPGSNVLRLQRASGTGGRAVVTWRDRFGGI